MKVATKSFCLGSVMAVTMLGVDSAWAQTAEQVAAAREILAQVPAAELAARSARLVAEAPTKERATVAAAVGQAVARVNPGVTPSVVAAVSARSPAIAPAVTAAAAGVLKESAPAIAVAASGAPGVNLRDVRAAVIAAVPAQAVEIVRALARGKAGE